MSEITGQEDDNKNLNTDGTTPLATDDKGQKPAGSGTGTEPPKGYVSEESYKGLQKVLDKKQRLLEDQIAALQAKLDSQSVELEEKKLEAAKKAELERQQAELNTNLQNLQAERDQLSRKLNQQGLVLAKFPELAPLAAYIPPADTDEAFIENATNFQAALKTYLAATVQGKLAGATPPIGGGNEGGDTKKVTDELYNKVVGLAGVPGKETEYEEAYAKYREAFLSQK